MEFHMRRQLIILPHSVSVIFYAFMFLWSWLRGASSGFFWFRGANLSFWPFSLFLCLFLHFPSKPSVFFELNSGLANPEVGLRAVILELRSLGFRPYTWSLISALRASVPLDSPSDSDISPSVSFWSLAFSFVRVSLRTPRSLSVSRLAET